jgi:penicillin-binding protein 1C
LPPPLKRFQPARLGGAGSQASLRIVFPPDGARLDLAATDGKANAVPLKITGAVAPLTVLVNGVPVPEQDHGALFFRPDGPGFSRVTVIDSAGATATAVVRVDDGSAAKLTVR